MFNYKPTYYGSDALKIANRISEETVNKNLTPLQKTVIHYTPDDVLIRLMSEKEKKNFMMYCNTMQNIDKFNNSVKLTPENKRAYELYCENNRGGKKSKKTKKRRYKKNIGKRSVFKILFKITKT